MSASSVHQQQKPSDDAFYENLTLGLIKVLSKELKWNQQKKLFHKSLFLDQIPRINNINYDKRNPAERNSVNAWETRHNCHLPSDMKAFYLSTDGFCLFWSYEYSATENKRVGKIHIPHLIQITLIRENLESLMAANKNPAKTPHNANDAIPSLDLTSKSKIFELNTILDLAKVVMVYEVPESCVMKIYLLEMETLKLHFLADTFTEFVSK